MIPRALQRHSLRLSTLAGLALATAGCDLPRAHGDQNAFIVAADPALWESVSGPFLDAMEPTILTVRNERPFRITHQDPQGGADWGNLRRFRQVLVLGDGSDPWVQEVLAEAEPERVPDPPGILQVPNVWARGQMVSLLLLPEGGDAEAAVAQFAPELREILDEQYRLYAQTRMYVSGYDSIRADSLLTAVGFGLTLPNVYRWANRDSIYWFTNDNPSPTELIREVSVTWDTPIPATDPTREEIESWRLDFTGREYTNAQLHDTAVVASYREIEVNGLRGVEFQSAWVSPPGAWPAGGPFITRALRCPSQNRLYWVDAWLYAPRSDKYEYMIQLQTILDSFRCR